MAKATDDFDSLFRLVTEEYQNGKLTLGEAADLLGLNRWEYDSQLQKLGILQKTDPRSELDIEALQALVEKLRHQ